MIAPTPGAPCHVHALPARAAASAGRARTLCVEQGQHAVNEEGRHTAAAAAAQRDMHSPIAAAAAAATAASQRFLKPPDLHRLRLGILEQRAE